MEIIHQPHIDLELQSLIERIYPPRVSIDNDSCADCTVVKVDSANKHGILLEMVQVLTDLDLVISKSFISSDGGWFMDVFHVTDQFGNKLIDESLMLYIQQALCASRRGEISRENEEALADKTTTAVLEMTGEDGPGLLSEISAVLVELGCKVGSATVWTHNDKAACIMYVEEASTGGPITDPIRMGHIQQLLESVVEAHHDKGEKRRVRLRTLPGRVGHTHSHTERRLHQLMYMDRDYERCGDHNNGCDGTHVSIGRCDQKGYWVVNVRSRDRPKLLLDTLCVLTDMQYVVFHAAITSNGSMADQEYFVRHNKDSSALPRESEKQKLTLCLIAAIERRVSHGLRIDICTENRAGLLWEVTRVFRENGLWISRVEIGTRGQTAEGSFYVRDSSGEEVNPNIVELVREEVGGSVVAVHKSPYRLLKSSSSSSSSTKRLMHEDKRGMEGGHRFSLGSMLWSHIERLSGSFGSIRS